MKIFNSIDKQQLQLNQFAVTIVSTQILTVAKSYHFAQRLNFIDESSSCKTKRLTIDNLNKIQFE